MTLDPVGEGIGGLYQAILDLLWLTIGSRCSLAVSMRGALYFTVALAMLSPLLAQNYPAPVPAEKTLLVLSVRQYLEVGKSNIHLYQYSLDGKLVKVLTDEPGFDDLNPLFKFDGSQVMFTRVPTDAAHQGKGGLYVVDLPSGHVSPLQASGREDFPSGDAFDTYDVTFSGLKGQWRNSIEDFYQSPDGKFKLTAKPFIGEDGAPPGRKWLFQEPGKVALEFESLSGFLPDQDLTGFEDILVANGSPFAAAGDLQAIFVSQPLGSTDGDRIWGFDLLRKKWVKLAENGGTVYHMPSCPGIFVEAESRYLPLGKTGKTVDCRNLEWCDGHLTITKFAPGLSVFCSAALYHQAPNGSAEYFQIVGAQD